MPDKIIGFDSESDFDRMSKSVRMWESKPATGRQQRRLYPFGSSGGKEVRIKIKSVDTGATPKTAVASISGFDRNTTKVPGENNAGEITVIDRTGCHLVSPYSDLLCKRGYARYMHDRDTDEKAWEIVSLECDPPCNVQCYPYFVSDSQELAFADALLASDIDILFLTSGTNGCDGDNAICTWNTPRYTDPIIDFIKSGRSVFVFGEVENAPLCMSQSEIDDLNSFYAAIGGDAHLVLDDLAVGCQVGGIVADSSHPFVKDADGNQNVFFYGVGGSSEVVENGSTAFVYLYDPVAETTDNTKCLLAGNQYPEAGGGWVFLCGDANMNDSPSCKSLGDLDQLYTNICRIQCTDNMPES